LKTPWQIVNRVWNSPTFMTWGSFLARTSTLLVVTPLVLNRLSASEISLWYLFSTLISLQVLADIGFTPTFARIIAYAMGGADLSSLNEYRSPTGGQTGGQTVGSPNWQTVEAICTTMRAINVRLMIASVVLLASLGTAALLKPVAELPNPATAWACWGIILLACAVNFYGSIYSSYLQGINQIAVLRRWEILTSLGAVISSFLALILGTGLVGLVVSSQLWVVLNVIRNRWLCTTVEQGHFAHFRSARIHPQVFQPAWSSAWRSGLGHFMNYGLMQASGLVYAQTASTAGIASYLFAQRLLQVVSMFAQAPFYSKLPTLARLRAEGKISEQIVIAQKGMRLSYWTYAVGFISIGLLAEPMLKLIGSNAAFVNPLLWLIMGVGMFVERYGAMHIHLYSTTNHIIWHIANGVAGVIYLATALVLFPIVGVYAFPIAVLAGYLGFYAWYAARHSYRAFGLKFWRFERMTLLPPATVVLLYCGITLGFGFLHSPSLL
jgi:O-antigen/teichoic acid export membrane protein